MAEGKRELIEAYCNEVSSSNPDSYVMALADYCLHVAWHWPIALFVDTGESLRHLAQYLNKLGPGILKYNSTWQHAADWFELSPHCGYLLFLSSSS